jgi:hypothetical protein
MKNEIMMELAEQRQNEEKAIVCDKLFIILNNAIMHIEETTGEGDDYISKYLGISLDELDAIRNEDYTNI